MQEMKVGVVGCGGRMGLLLLAEIGRTEGMALVGGVDPSPIVAGLDLGELADLKPCGIAVESHPGALLRRADVIIDFTMPDATVALAARAAEAGVALVIGTTGLDPRQMAAIRTAATKIPIVMAANFSIGITLFLKLVEETSRMLGPDYDIEILEMHHRRKIDAPSGTALALGEAAAAGRGASLEELRSDAAPRVAGAIGFASLRGGDVVGDHTVMFAGDGERLELAHKASDRRVFAAGALRAARWIVGRSPGLYDMKDVVA